MLTRKFDNLLEAWQGLIEELCYSGVGKISQREKPIRGGSYVAFPDLLEVKIKNAVTDSKLHLDMSSFTKTRWTRFMRRYFRPDFVEWIDETAAKLKRKSRMPLVASYSINLNEEVRVRGRGATGGSGHVWGGCLGSLQIRVCPEPEVILYSRACMIDKIGFLDLCLIHLVAKQLDIPVVKATWVISVCFITPTGQLFYVPRFKKKLKGHVFSQQIKKHLALKEEDVIYSPVKRALKRNRQMKTLGHIPGSVAVKDMSLEFTLNERAARRARRLARKAKAEQ